MAIHTQSPESLDLYFGLEQAIIGVGDRVMAAQIPDLDADRDPRFVYEGEHAGLPTVTHEFRDQASDGRGLEFNREFVVVDGELIPMSTHVKVWEFGKVHNWAYSVFTDRQTPGKDSALSEMGRILISKTMYNKPNPGTKNTTVLSYGSSMSGNGLSTRQKFLFGPEFIKRETKASAHFSSRVQEGSNVAWSVSVDEDSGISSVTTIANGVSRKITTSDTYRKATEN